MKKKYQIIAISVVIALTCWGIGEMALKTGYKVENKEIILDDYNRYKDSNLTDPYTKTLGGYYKANGNDIKASYYVEDKGQTVAELPGDNYYKTPSNVEVPKFSNYGTSILGGYYKRSDGIYLYSPYWVRYDGKNDGNYKIISILFDGNRLGEADVDPAGNYYISTELYKYETYCDKIKVYCYMVSTGGGGSSTGGGGGGGSSAAVCLILNVGEIIRAYIPPQADIDKDGESLNLFIKRGSFLSEDKIVEITGGKRGDGLKGGDSGTPTIYTKKEGLIYWYEKKGGRGGNGGSTSIQASDGESSSTGEFADIKADFLPLCRSEAAPGGQKNKPTSSDIYLGGGGSSPFIDGNGGQGGAGDLNKYRPGTGGGGGGMAPSGAGAFWLLYA